MIVDYLYQRKEENSIPRQPFPHSHCHVDFFCPNSRLLQIHYKGEHKMACKQSFVLYESVYDRFERLLKAEKLEGVNRYIDAVMMTIPQIPQQAV